MLEPDFYKKANQFTLEAGRLLARLSQDPSYRVPQAKGDGSPVTQADIEVSAFLVDRLNTLGFLVVSEESLPVEAPGKGDSYFLVDPLDGTKYYSRGEDEFAVCVGFLSQGKPVYGAIQDPTRDKLYWGVKGLGAFCDDERIKHPGPSEKLTVFSSGFHKKSERRWIIDELNIGEIREKGSALKFCDIAAGEVDLYLRFGPTSEWDTAAAQVILEESDCVLLEVKTGKTMEYAKSNYLNRGVIACHKSVESSVIELLKKHFWVEE